MGGQHSFTALRPRRLGSEPSGAERKQPGPGSGCRPAPVALPVAQRQGPVTANVVPGV